MTLAVPASDVSKKVLVCTPDQTQGASNLSISIYRYDAAMIPGMPQAGKAVVSKGSQPADSYKIDVQLSDFGVAFIAFRNDASFMVVASNTVGDPDTVRSRVMIGGQWRNTEFFCSRSVE